QGANSIHAPRQRCYPGRHGRPARGRYERDHSSCLLVDTALTGAARTFLSSASVSTRPPAMTGGISASGNRRQMLGSTSAGSISTASGLEVASTLTAVFTASESSRKKR